MKTIKTLTKKKRLVKIALTDLKEYFVMCDNDGQVSYSFPFKSFKTLNGAVRYGNRFLA